MVPALPRCCSDGHLPRSCLPADLAFLQTGAKSSPPWTVDLVNSASADHYNRSAHPLPPLKPGTRVDLQHPSTKLWQQHGTIVSVGRHRDYHIRLPSGRVLRRYRLFLRPRVMPRYGRPFRPCTARPASSYHRVACATSPKHSVSQASRPP